MIIWKIIYRRNMTLKLVQPAYLGICLSLLFIGVITGMTLRPSQSINFGRQIHYIGIIEGQRWALWSIDGFIQVYDMNNQVLLFQINMRAEPGLAMLTPSIIKISPDLSTLLSIQGNQICWVVFGTNLFDTTVMCQRDDRSDNIIRNDYAISAQFLEGSNMIFVLMDSRNRYVIANLSQASPRIIFQNTSSTIVDTYRWDFKNKIIGLTDSGELLQMQFNLSNNNYNFVSKGIFTSGQTVIAFERNGVECVFIRSSYMFYAYQIPSITLQSTALVQDIYDVIELQGTIVYTQSTQQVLQLQIPIFQYLGSPVAAPSFSSIVRRPIFKDGLFLIFIFNSNSSVLTCIKITKVNPCLSYFPNCDICDLTITKCIECDSSSILNQSNCILANCFKGQFFNKSTMQCQSLCSIQQTYDNITSQCQCNSGRIRNQLDRMCYCPNGTSLDTNKNQCIALPCSTQNCLKCQQGSSSVCVKCSNNYLLKDQGTCQFSQVLKIVGELANLTTYPLSVPSLKTIAKTSILIFLFLDDYWYYIYHKAQYRTQTQFVFNLIKQTNQASIVPQFININSIQEAINPNLYMASNYSIFTPAKVQQIDGQDIQFLKRSHEMYTYNFSASLIIFVIFKLITKLLKKRQDFSEQGLFYKIVSFLTDFSYIKSLIVSIFESSIIFFSFSCSLQLFQPGCYMFQDRLSMMVSHLFFFAILIYSICFYPMVFALEKRQQTLLYLNYSRYSFRGILNQTLVASLRNFISGFIQAYLIYHYELQISSLIAVKLSVIFFMFKFRKQFKQKAVLVILHIYFTLGIALDLIFVVGYGFGFQITESGIIQALTLALLFACTALLFIYLSGIALWNFTKQTFCKNKIKPINQAYQQQSKSKKSESQQTSNIQSDKNDNSQIDEENSIQTKPVYVSSKQQTMKRQNIILFSGFHKKRQKIEPKVHQKHERQRQKIFQDQYQQYLKRCPQQRRVKIKAINRNKQMLFTLEQYDQALHQQPNSKSDKLEYLKNIKNNDCLHNNNLIEKKEKCQKINNKQQNNKRNTKQKKTIINLKKDRQTKTNNLCLIVNFDNKKSDSVFQQ